MTARTIKLRGKYWFELAYAAKLLGTTKAVVETLAIRKKLRSKEIDGEFYIAEQQVTEFRRNGAAWKALKAGAKLPAAPKRPAIGGTHQHSPDQKVLPIADYRLQLGPGLRLKD